MTIHHQDSRVTLHHGDCLDVLRSLPDASVDSVVTDPPYNLAFMGKGWDTHDSALGFQQWCEAWARECLRVLRPGGHLLAFGGTRTWHRLACAVEDAGFEVRDSIAWLYGSGFPKSLDVSKAIDKAAGAEREVVGVSRFAARRPNGHTGTMRLDGFTTVEELERAAAAGEATPYGRDAATTLARYRERAQEGNPETAPATDAAREWAGWGTAMKPAFEPVVVARKTLVGTVAANVLAHGTGALNIDGCRIGTEGGGTSCTNRDDLGACRGHGNAGRSTSGETFHGPDSSGGRWPANVILDEDMAGVLDQQSGTSKSSVRKPSGKDDRGVPNTSARMVMRRNDTDPRGVADSGGASRFFTIIPTQQEKPCATPSPEPAPTTPATGAPDASSAASTTASTAAPVAASGDPTDGPPFLYVAKAPKRERPVVDGVAHPTVKPLALMRWLVRLVTPPGGTVLEPFAGSGTTVEACLLEGFACIAIEKGDEYLPLILARIRRQSEPLPEAAELVRPVDPDEAILEQIAGQLDIFGEGVA